MAQKVDYASLKKRRIYETETERLRFPEDWQWSVET